jgi:hypothetical protein
MNDQIVFAVTDIILKTTQELSVIHREGGSPSQALEHAVQRASQIVDTVDRMRVTPAESTPKEIGSDCRGCQRNWAMGKNAFCEKHPWVPVKDKP